MISMNAYSLPEDTTYLLVQNSVLYICCAFRKEFYIRLHDIFEAEAR